MSDPRVTVYDWTEHEPNPPPRLVRAGAARFREDANGKLHLRKPEEIDGICVHQTACTFGPANDIQKRHERAFDVPIHALAFKDGVVVRPYPLLAYLFHGNGWNGRSLGIEIEGQYAGVEGSTEHPPVRDHDATTRMQGDVLDDLTIATAREGIRVLVEAGRAAGCPIRRIWAHRQSTASRRADPGEAIWRHVVMEYAVPVLGLVTQPQATLKDGRAIPRQWGDPGATAAY